MPHRHGDHFIAKTPGDGRQARAAGLVRAGGETDEKPSAHAQHIASLDSRGELDALDSTMLPEFGLHAGGFAASRDSTHRAYYGNLVQHDRRVLDEYAVGKVTIHGKCAHVGAAPPKHRAVRFMLLEGTAKIDRRRRDESTLALLQIRRRYVS